MQLHEQACISSLAPLSCSQTDLQDAASQAQGSERTAAAREAEADALCKENAALKQQLRSLQQDCGRSRGAFHAVSADLAELKDSFRQATACQANAGRKLGLQSANVVCILAGRNICLLAKAPGIVSASHWSSVQSHLANEMLLF